MRLLGIDYGSKRIGLALSDDRGMMAFPHSVIPNDKKVFVSIAEVIRKSGVDVVVVGESKNYKGEPNKIMSEISLFVQDLKRMGYRVKLEPEILSSHQASHFQGKTDMTDASAASIILQSFIDRHKLNMEHEA